MHNNDNDNDAPLPSDEEIDAMIAYDAATQLTLNFHQGETPEERHAYVRAVAAQLRGPRVDRRLRRLQDAADAGFDTWEEYRGER